MRVLAALAGLLIAVPPAARGTPVIDGEYESPLGRVRIVGGGGAFRGVLVSASSLCAFREGEEVLRATLLDDSLAGQVRVCLAGKGCGAREEWGSAVLLASPERLSGAVHVASKRCRAPLGKRGGVAFVRVASARDAGTGATAAPAALAGAPGQARRAGREAARAALREGAAWLHEGSFEAARRRFLEAIALDPTVPEAYNGVGVTYRMRNDLPRALEWYKKALGVDPDFGDAYYNMACVYAIEGQREMALRYLQIAALNGYASADGMDADPDLESVRQDPAYRALVRAKM